MLSTLPKTLRRLIHIEERKSLPIGMCYLVTQEISLEKQWWVIKRTQERAWKSAGTVQR